MRKLYWSLWVTLAIAITNTSAQESIREEWLAKDLANITLMSKFLPIERQVPQKLIDELGLKFSSGAQEIILVDPSDDFGFDYKRINLNRPGGYCHVSLEGYLFRNRFTYYRLGISCSLDSWKKIASRVIKSWENNIGKGYLRKDDGVYFEKDFDEALQSYKLAVNAEFGRLNTVNVPRDLKQEYEALISPFQNPTIGRDGCGVAGIVPWGKRYIDSLVKQNRIDLLENIVRGFNPGGRIYALVALLEFKSKGVTLSRATEESLQKVSEFESKVEFCSGGTISHKSAGEILKEYNLK